MQQILFKMKTIVSFCILFCAIALAQSAFALPNTDLAVDTDPEFYSHLAIDWERIQPNCAAGTAASSACRFKIIQRFHNPRITSEGVFSVDVQIKAGQAPLVSRSGVVAGSEMLSQDMTGNFTHFLGAFVSTGGADGVLATADTLAADNPICTVTLSDNVLTGYNSMTDINIGPFNEGIGVSAINSNAARAGGNAEMFATAYQLPHQDFDTFYTLTCNIPEAERERFAGMSIGFNSPFANNYIADALGANFPMHGMIYNNLDYFPLDGTSAYIEHAELSDTAEVAYLRFNRALTEGDLDGLDAANFKMLLGAPTEDIADDMSTITMALDADTILANGNAAVRTQLALGADIVSTPSFVVGLDDLPSTATVATVEVEYAVSSPTGTTATTNTMVAIATSVPGSIDATAVAPLNDRTLWVSFDPADFRSNPAVTTNTAIYLSAHFPPPADAAADAPRFIADEYSNRAAYRVAYSGHGWASASDEVVVISAMSEDGTSGGVRPGVDENGNVNGTIVVTFNTAVSRSQRADVALEPQNFILEYFPYGESDSILGSPVSVVAAEDNQTFTLELPEGISSASFAKIIVRANGLLDDLIVYEGTEVPEPRFYQTNSLIFSGGTAGRSHDFTYPVPNTMFNNQPVDGMISIFGARSLMTGSLVEADVVARASTGSITEGETVMISVTNNGAEAQDITITVNRSAGDARTVSVDETVILNADDTEGETSVSVGTGDDNMVSVLLSIQDDGAFQGNSTYTVTVTGALGALGLEVIDNDTAIAEPPGLPSNTRVTASQIGATKAELRFAEATGSDLRYYALVTDLATEISHYAVVVEEVETRERTRTVELNRSNVVLIPGRDYSVTIIATDTRDNGLPEGLPDDVTECASCYDPVSVIMMDSIVDNNRDGFDDDLYDALLGPDGVLQRDGLTVNEYCGIADSADADGDGVSNIQELVIGTDCRTTEIAGFDDSTLYAGGVSRLPTISPPRTRDVAGVPTPVDLEVLNNAFVGGGGHNYGGLGMRYIVGQFNTHSELRDRVDCEGSGGCQLFAYSVIELTALCPDDSTQGYINIAPGARNLSKVCSGLEAGDDATNLNLYEHGTGRLSVPSASASTAAIAVAEREPQQIVWMVRDGFGNIVTDNDPRLVYVAPGVDMGGNDTWSRQTGRDQLNPFMVIYGEVPAPSSEYVQLSGPIAEGEDSAPSVEIGVTPELSIVQSRMEAGYKVIQDLEVTATYENPGRYELRVIASAFDSLFMEASDTELFDGRYDSSYENLLTVRGLRVDATASDTPRTPALTNLEWRCNPDGGVGTVTLRLRNVGYFPSNDDVVATVNFYSLASDDDEMGVLTATSDGSNAIVGGISSQVIVQGRPAGVRAEVFLTDRNTGIDYRTDNFYFDVSSDFNACGLREIPGATTVARDGGFFYEDPVTTLGFAQGGYGTITSQTQHRLDNPLRTAYYVYDGTQYAEFTEAENLGQLFSADGCDGGRFDGTLTPGLVSGYSCILARVQDGGINDPDSTQNGQVILTAAVGPSGLSMLPAMDGGPDEPAPALPTPAPSSSGGGSAGLWMIALLASLMSGLLLGRNRRRVYSSRR